MKEEQEAMESEMEQEKSAQAEEGTVDSKQPSQAPGAKGAEETEESLSEKVGQYWDQLLRLQAEFANYRKRTEKEKAEAIRFGRELMIEKLISLADIMEQALQHTKNAKDVESLKKGFELVASEFSKFLRLENAEPLKTVGEPFDPHQHEAVEQVETDKEEENNIILEEVQKGYTFNGRLLRPARVKVAKYKKG